MYEAASAYDALAGRYDELEGGNRILALMRRRSLDAILRAMPEGSRLLELGAGTGTEAVAVSRQKGASVLAVEPSPAQAARARAKALAADARVEVVEARASAALADLSAHRALFDGAWSSFALGYDAPLEDLKLGLASVLRTKAPAVISLRNPWCLAEPWSLLVRMTGGYRHKVGTSRVALRHYSLFAARALLAPEFVFERAEALPAIVPPPRYGAAWNRIGQLAGALERLDAALAPRAPFVGLGDHTLLSFRRL